MHRWTPLAAALLTLALAQGVGISANDRRARWPRTVEMPYAPSPAAAPFVTAGYREMAADLWWIRTIGYANSQDDTPERVAALVRAVNSLDPMFMWPYYEGAQRVIIQDKKLEQRDFLAAVDILENGIENFPKEWRLAYSAGQIYVLDLKSDDKAQQAAWTERGLSLIERSVRMPDAPAQAATLAAHMRSKLGQHERAVNGLRELILITRDDAGRKKLIAKLAKLQNQSAEEVASAVEAERRAFLKLWRAERGAVPPTMYVLLGRKNDSHRTPHDLAVDRSLFGSEGFEELEPLYPPEPVADDAPAGAAAPQAPAAPPATP